MDRDLRNLLSQVYELESIILLIEENKLAKPDIVYHMIKGKAKELAHYTEAYMDNLLDTYYTNERKKHSVEGQIEALPEDEPDEDIDAEFVFEADEASSEDTVEETDTESAPSEDNTTEAEVAEETTPTEEILPEQEEEEYEEEYEDEYDDEYNDEEEEYEEEEELIFEETPTEEETVSEPIPEEECAEAEGETSEQEESTPQEEIIEEKPAEPAHNAFANANTDIKLDEALQRSMTKDLRHAFSLNDRFRYRRELFENSDVVMNETLDLVAAMNSYDEAEEYFYNDLGWELESPEVADFMVVIKNHFWNKQPQ